MQSELRKTIVFITHDIDEAVQLGDKVAVFGRAGPSCNTPIPPLSPSNPANELVSGFVGAGPRLPRAAVLHASGLPLHEIEHVDEDDIDALEPQPGEWRLVIKSGTPFAWINAEGVEVHRKGNALYDSTIGVGRSSARRQPAAGAGLRAVLTEAASVGGRRRRQARRGSSAPTMCSRHSRSSAASRSWGQLVRYLLNHLDDLWVLTVVHLRLSVVPIVLGLLIAVPLGAAVQRTTALRCG